MQGKKAPRVAKEKIAAGGIPKTKTERKKGGAGETVLLVLVFGVTFLVFLQFTGMVDLPFLRFLPFGKSRVGAQQETVMVPPKGEEEVVLYPGPTLEGTPPPQVEVPEEGATPREAEGEVETPQVALVVTPMPSEAPQSPAPSPEPSPTPSGLGNLTRVARIYSAMEPQDAAKILEQWDDEEVVQVLLAMKERDAARILNAMSAEKASSVLKKMREGR